MLDLIIENGKIVSPDNVIEAAIGIKDDKIVMIGDKADMHFQEDAESYYY